MSTTENCLTNNLRTYGSKPFRVAVIHGGPGAPGEMAPVARALAASSISTLEPFQTATTVGEQVKELVKVLEKQADIPVTLIGFSWGAWLSFIFAAHYPVYVKKLILISSGPFESQYARDIMETRFHRLKREDKEEVCSLMAHLNSPEQENKSNLIARFGELLAWADAYDPLPLPSNGIACQPDAYCTVWEQASELRRSGKLLKLGESIQCPVVAIHGDYDPHPAEGVRVPLSHTLKDFRFILLKKCGHHPWCERHAREEFYRILKNEINS